MSNFSGNRRAYTHTKFWTVTWYREAIKRIRKGCFCRRKDCLKAAVEFVGDGEYLCRDHLLETLRERLA